jgi:sugar phosphate isomerase/epimerase
MISQALPIRAADENAAQPQLKVAIFSKHLQFLLSGEELAKATADIGFDAIDLTVRKGGHVQPERVAQDLPLLVGIIRQHGLKVHLITTDIVDADSPFAEDILKTMVTLRIHHYRWGNLRFVAGQPYGAQLEQMKLRIAKLAELNSRYQACAMYHIESGAERVGSAVLDLYMLLKEFDPKAVGVNYDVANGVEGGGGGSWMNSFRIMEPYIRGIAVRDFDRNKDASGAWGRQFKPLGEGLIPFPQFFTLVAEARFSGLVEIIAEYLLGGETDSKGTGVVDRKAVYSGLKRDLTKLRGYLLEAHL